MNDNNELTADVVLVLVNRDGDVMHGGWDVLRTGLTESQAVAVCSDKRTSGRNYFVAWTRFERMWKWQRKDNGQLDLILAEYGL